MKKIYLLAVTFIFAMNLPAPVEGVPSLIDLVKNSDVIVAGTCIEVEVIDGNAKLHIQPISIFKGELPVAVAVFSVPLVRYDSHSDIRGALRGKDLILFGNAGAYPNEWSAVRTSVFSPLVNTLIVSPAGVQDFLPDLQAESPLQKTIKAVAAAHWRNPGHRTLELLIPLSWRRVETEFLEKIFEEYIASGDPGLMQTGLGGITMLGQPLAVFKTDEMLRTLPEKAAAEQVASLEMHYDSDSDDADALKIIMGWMQSDNPAVRAGAAGILARLRSPSCILLLGDALFDPEFEVRWRAIGGLSAFANHVPRKSMAPAPGPWALRTEDTIAHSVFSRDAVAAKESHYLDFWRDWWRENRAAVVSLASDQ